MLPTVSLPPGVCVRDAGERVRVAFESFMRMEATRYRLADWLTGDYQRALVVGGREFWPFTLHVSSNVEATVAEAQRVVGQMREAASSVDGSLVERLPQRVHVVRIRDEAGAFGFAPIDVKGASLIARALSLLVADYLMRPEAYLDGGRAA